MYFGEDTGWAMSIASPNLVFNYIWVIDGEKCYTQYINHEYLYQLDWDFPGVIIRTLDALEQYDWKKVLLEVIDFPLDDWFENDEKWLSKHNEYKDLLRKKLQVAKTVELLSPYSFFIYEVEVTPRRIFFNEKNISEKQRKLFNQQLKREQRKFSIPYPIDYLPNEDNFYDYLHRRFSKRYKSDSYYDNTRRTSLFLLRAGFDLMYMDNMKEYVLFDISRVKILKVIEIGG